MRISRVCNRVGICSELKLVIFVVKALELQTEAVNLLILIKGVTA